VGMGQGLRHTRGARRRERLQLRCTASSARAYARLLMLLLLLLLLLRRLLLIAPPRCPRPRARGCSGVSWPRAHLHHC